MTHMARMHILTRMFQRIPACTALITMLAIGPVIASASNTVRVVSLAPNLTEIICAVGGLENLVGRTTFCDYPPEVKTVPVIGGFGAPSLEALVAANPDLVLDIDLEDESTAQKIEAIGLKRRRIDCKTLADIPSAVLETGRLIGRASEASALSHLLSTGLAELNAAPTPTNAPRVFVEIWNDPLMTCGKDSFISDIIRLAGGTNIGDELDVEYGQVSSEWVVSRDPEIVLCLEGTDNGHAARDSAMSRSGWQNVSAVKSGRIHDDLDIDTVSRPGPRVLDGIGQVRSRVMGEPDTE